MVSPGFIDAHSHNDFYVNKPDSSKSILPFLKQGITSQVVGNCGFSAYGVHKESKYKELVGSGLFKTTKPGTLDDYIKLTEGTLDVNIIPLVGHGTTRISLAGYESRELTRYELAKELEILEENLKMGAFGGSLGLMYVPSMYAPNDELIKFAEMIKKYDGILTVHPRACSKVSMGYPLLSRSHIEQALDEVIDIMEKTQVRTEYSHLIFVGKSSWKSVDPMLMKFHELKEKGFEIGYDMYPFTFGASVITVVLPAWYMKMTDEEKKKKSTRFKLKALITITKKLLGIEFSDITVAYIGPDYSAYEGKTISEIAKKEGVNEFDMYLKLVDLSNGNGRIFLDKYYNEAIIAKLMDDDLSVFMTDAWYEDSGSQNASSYQAMPYFIQKAMERKLPLERIINKMTGATADRFKIPQRGYLKEGFAADITIFDAKAIIVNPKVADSTPSGIQYVIVNGEMTIDHGKYLKPKAGKVLRKNK
jgi:N-acyl-D-amino-acid deacylase